VIPARANGAPKAKLTCFLIRGVAAVKSVAADGFARYRKPKLPGIAGKQGGTAKVTSSLHAGAFCLRGAKP